MNPGDHVLENEDHSLKREKYAEASQQLVLKVFIHVMEGSGDAIKRGTIVAAGKPWRRTRRASPAHKKGRGEG